MSKGLMQTIPATYRTEYDPLANMTAAVNYAQEMVARPRRGGKATAIEKAIELAKEAGFARGGVVGNPASSGVEARLAPGEFVMTPESARRFGWPPRSVEELLIELDELDDPPDDYPDPPTLRCF